MTTNIDKEQIISDNSEVIKSEMLNVDDETFKKPVSKTSDEVAAETKKINETVKVSKKKKLVPECNICREKLTKDTYIRCPLCKQFFCKFCIEDWLLRMRNNRVCPLCAKKWEDKFICNNLPLGFVINKLRLRIYGLYSYDYEYEPANKSRHDDIDEQDEESVEESNKEEEDYTSNNSEKNNSESINRTEEDEEDDEQSMTEHDSVNNSIQSTNTLNIHSENSEENREEENRDEENREEENIDEHQNRREDILDFILGTSNINADQDTLNLIRGLILSDLFDN